MVPLPPSNNQIILLVEFLTRKANFQMSCLKALFRPQWVGSEVVEAYPLQFRDLRVKFRLTLLVSESNSLLRSSSKLTSNASLMVAQPSARLHSKFWYMEPGARNICWQRWPGSASSGTFSLLRQPSTMVSTLLLRPTRNTLSTSPSSTSIDYT